MILRRAVAVFGISCFVVFSFSLAGVASAQYYVTDLGVLSGGTSSQAYAVNSAGQVVGYSTTSSGANQAFLYSNASMSDIGQYYAAYPNSGTGSIGWKTGGGINQSGVVAWTDNGPLGDAYSFIYSGGTTVTPLDSYSGVGSNPTFSNNINFVTGITDNGLVSGFSLTPAATTTPSFATAAPARLPASAISA